jgi:hypothetical protein
VTTRSLLDAVKAVGFFPGPRAVSGRPVPRTGCTRVRGGPCPSGSRRCADHRHRGRLAKRGRRCENCSKGPDRHLRAADLRRSARAAPRSNRCCPRRRLANVDRAAMADRRAARRLAARRLPPDHRKAGALQARRCDTGFTRGSRRRRAAVTREAELDDILHATAEAALGRDRPDPVAPEGAGRRNRWRSASRRCDTFGRCMPPPATQRAAPRRACGAAAAGLRPAPGADAAAGPRWGRPQLETALSMLVETDIAALGHCRAADGDDGTHADPPRDDAALGGAGRCPRGSTAPKQ